MFPLNRIPPNNSLLMQDCRIFTMAMDAVEGQPTVLTAAGWKWVAMKRDVPETRGASTTDMWPW